MDSEYTLENFMIDFENRKGKEEEEKLIFYLDYATRDENFSATTSSRKADAVYRYEKVNSILNTTDQEVIDSNIYLKKCKQYLKDTKEPCVDLLIDYKSNNETDVTTKVSTEEILPVIEDRELQGMELVENYNTIANELLVMYNEIARLNMWNLIDKEKDSKDNIQTVNLKDKDGIVGQLTASFKNLKRCNYGYCYQKNSTN